MKSYGSSSLIHIKKIHILLYRPVLNSNISVEQDDHHILWFKSKSPLNNSCWKLVRFFFFFAWNKVKALFIYLFFYFFLDKERKRNKRVYKFQYGCDIMTKADFASMFMNTWRIFEAELSLVQLKTISTNLRNLMIFPFRHAHCELSVSADWWIRKNENMLLHYCSIFPNLNPVGNCKQHSYITQWHSWSAFHPSTTGHSHFILFLLTHWKNSVNED